MKHRYATPVIAFFVLRLLACGSTDDPSPGAEGGGSPAGAGGHSDGGRAGKAGSTGKAGSGGKSGSSSESGSGGEPSDAGAGGSSDGGAGGEAGSGRSPDCPVGDRVAHPNVCADKFTITMLCSGGECDGQVFVHNYDVTWRGFEFGGTGESTAMGNDYTESICGAIAGDKLAFHSIYTTIAAGYTIDGTATLASNNTAEGLASGVDAAGASQEFSIAVTALKVGCE